MSNNKTIEFRLRVVLMILGVCLFLAVKEIYWPVIVSLIITFILTPLRDGIQKGLVRLFRRQVPIDISILLSFVVLIAVIAVMTNSILKPLIGQLNLLANNFSTIVSQTYELVVQLESDQAPIYIPDHVNLYPSDYRLHLRSYFEELSLVLSRYIRGQLLMSCIIACLTFTGMWIMGVPYPLVIALLAAITEWIPVIGPIVGAIPAILLGATISPSLALKVLIFYAVVQQIDGHLIMPQVMGKVISIHPVVIVIALLIGGTLFGVAGMILTVPLVAVLQTTARHLWFFSSYRERMSKNDGKD